MNSSDEVSATFIIVAKPVQWIDFLTIHILNNVRTINENEPDQVLENLSDTKENWTPTDSDGIIVTKLSRRPRTPSFQSTESPKPKTVPTCRVADRTDLVPTTFCPFPPPQWAIVNKSDDVRIMKRKCENRDWFIDPADTEWRTPPVGVKRSSIYDITTSIRCANRYQSNAGRSAFPRYCSCATAKQTNTTAYFPTLDVEDA